MAVQTDLDTNAQNAKRIGSLLGIHIEDNWVLTSCGWTQFSYGTFRTLKVELKFAIMRDENLDPAVLSIGQSRVEFNLELTFKHPQSMLEVENAMRALGDR